MAQPLRVTFTVPWGRPVGGAEAFLRTYLSTVDRARLTPRAIFFEPGPLADEVTSLGVPVDSIAVGRLREVSRFVRAESTLRRLIQQHEPDILLNWSAKTQIYAAPAARMAGLPSNRIMWFQHSIPSGHWIDRVATLTPADVIGCCSEAAAAGQRRLWPRRKLCVIHPGIPARQDPVPSRSDLGVPDDRIAVCILGRLQSWKGQHHVLRALAIARTRAPNLHAVVVGAETPGFSRGYDAELRQLTSSLGIVDHVTFVGELDQAARVLPAMDILINASSREPFGIVILEAMCAGLPVVAVRSGGATEVVVHGVTGVLVDSARPAAFAEVLVYLAADEQLRQRLGRAGRARFEQRFTAGAMAERLTNVLETSVRGAAERMLGSG